MILIDTHVLLWLVLQPEKIGERASRALQEATMSNVVHVTAITAWEIAMQVDKGRIELQMPTAIWITTTLARPGIKLAEVTVDIAVDAGQLPDGIHGDPADRIIIATARALGCPLVTADRKILAYAAAGHVRAIDARR